MKKDSSSDRFDALQKRIDKAQAKPEHQPSGAALAMRMGTELVAGVMVGAGFGYLIDDYFGTLPLFLVVLLFVGAAAGLKMMIQTSDRYSLDDETNSDE